MPPLDTFRLAWEALAGNKLRSGLTMLGMIIGVGAVVLLVSIGNGARKYITHEFEGLGTNLIIIQPGRTDTRSTFSHPVGSAQRKLSLGDVEALRRQGIFLGAVTGVMFGAGAVEIPGSKKNTTILGSNEQLPDIFNFKIRSGSFFSPEEESTGRRVAVLGANVASDFFPNQNPIGKTVKINQAEHRVIGYAEKMGQNLGFNLDDAVFIPTKSAMRIFNDDKLFGIRAKATSKAALNDAVEEIRDILKRRHAGEEDFTVLTLVSMLDTMNTILSMLTYVLGGIAMISMVVGGIGIMNIMLVSVTERTREIGIRRAVGARRKDVLRQFISEAVALSLMGGGLGLLGSVALTYVVTWWTGGSFDMRATGWIMGPAFGISALIGVLFGVWPARKASRIETIEALRYE